MTATQQTTEIKTLAQQIIGKRKAIGLSQVELARKSKVGQGYLSQIEQGTRQPSLDVLQRLAASLCCKPGDLLP